MLITRPLLLAATLALLLSAWGCSRANRTKAARPETPIADVAVGSKPVRTIAFTADGALLAAACNDRQIVIWDVESRKERARIRLDYAVQGLAFSPDSKKMAVVGDTWFVEILSVPEGKRLGQLKGAVAKLTCVAYSADGRRIAAGGVEFHIREWHASTGALAKTYRGLTGTPNFVAFSKDGSLLVSSGEDRTVRVWDRATATKVRELPTELDRTTQIGRVFSPDERRLLVPGRGDSVVAVDLATGQEFRRARHDAPLSATTASPTAYVAATAGGDAVRIWNMDNGQELRVIQLGNAKPRSLLFSPDGRLLAVALENGKVQIWSATSPDEGAKGAQR